MPRPRMPARRCRPAFTLVEMLVVLSIVLLLAILVAVFAPKVSERQKTASAGDRLQGWLVSARSVAKRDRTPTGIRLVADGVNKGQIKDIIHSTAAGFHGTAQF